MSTQSVQAASAQKTHPVPQAPLSAKKHQTPNKICSGYTKRLERGGHPASVTHNNGGSSHDLLAFIRHTPVSAIRETTDPWGDDQEVEGHDGLRRIFSELGMNPLF